MLTTAKLGPEGIRRHLDAIDTVNRRHRQILTAQVLQIYTGEWKHQAMERAAKVYKEQSTINEVWKFIDTTRNLQLRVTDEVVVAYTQPPRRVIQGKGATKANKVLQELVSESDMDCLAEEWARLAFCLGVVHVVPVVRKLERWPEKRLQFDTILPHNAEAIFEDNDPTHPAILLYDIDEGEKKRVALDGESWTYFDEHWNQIDRVDHNLGRCPATQFRVRKNLLDYWDCKSGERLRDSTLELARISAYKGWVRKCSSSKLATFFTEELDDGSDGPMTPEKGMAKPISPELASFQIHDYITPVADFIAEMKEIVENTAESFGVSAARVDPVNTGAVYTPSDHDQRAKNRRKQIKYLGRAERELWWTAAQMMQVHGHPMAKSFTPDRIKSGYTAEFGELSYVDEPMERLKVDNERIKLALASPVEVYMEHHPGVTEEEAQAAIERNIEGRGWMTEMQAKHGIANVPQAEPRDDMDNKAQNEGRVGGKAPPPKQPEE